MADLAHRPRTVVVSGVSSDAHTWNLVFLQLLLEGFGCTVVNLGPCVPDDLLLVEIERIRPDLVVLSSVNGHGHHDGARVVRKLRGTPGTAELLVVIGGKLGIHEDDTERHVRDLMAAGFDAVFADGDVQAVEFRRFLGLPSGAPRELAGPSA
jgi:methylaspartate mutase sigma subunit